MGTRALSCPAETILCTWEGLVGHALEVQPGTFARRVDPGGRLAELLFRYPDGPCEVFPAFEALPRRLGNITQRQRPELGELFRLGGVENDLDLGVHGQAPETGGTAGCSRQIMKAAAPS
jgi:hypothetical protein